VGHGIGDVSLARLDEAGRLNLPCDYHAAFAPTILSGDQTPDLLSVSAITTTASLGSLTFAATEFETTAIPNCNLLAAAYGGEGKEVAFGVTSDLAKAGGITLVGRTAAFSAGGDDAFALTTSVDGSPASQRRYGGASADGAAAVLRRFDAYYVAGATGSAGAGQSDGLLMRLDADLIPEWRYAYGDAASNTLSALVYDLTEGPIAAGTAVTGSVLADPDGWVVAVDDTGAVRWQRTYDGVNRGESFSAITSGPYNASSSVFTYVVAGHSYNLTTGTGDSALLASVDGEDGSLGWYGLYGDSGYEDARAVAYSPTGSSGSPQVTAAGSTDSFGAGGRDVWLFGVSAASGALNWQKSFGGAGTDYATALVYLGDGYLIAGNTTSFGAGGQDGWVIRTDLAGSPLWQLALGGPLTDSLNAAALNPEGNLILAGSSFSFGSGDEDVWVVVVTPQGEVNLGCGFVTPTLATVTTTTATRSTPGLSSTVVGFARATDNTSSGAAGALLSWLCPLIWQLFLPVILR
jgi:hypothetical protein